MMLLLACQTCQSKSTNDLDWTALLQLKTASQILYHPKRSLFVHTFASRFDSQTCPNSIWEPLRTFPPIQQNPMSSLDPSCPALGKTYPQLVTRDDRVRKSYRDYVCTNNPHGWLTDPSVSVRVQVSQLRGGCITQRPPWMQWVLALNMSCSVNLGRQCDSACITQKKKNAFSATEWDSDVLVLPTAAWDGLYQHALLDFISQAYTVLHLVQERKLKILSRSPMQRKWLSAIGLSDDHILLHVPPQATYSLFCVKPNRTLYTWRVVKNAADESGSELLPRYNEGPLHKQFWEYADLWHRLINPFIGSDISAAVLRGAQDESQSDEKTIIFVQRCAKSRAIANEEDALQAVQVMMSEASRPESLVPFCGKNLSILQQVRTMQRASLILGEHGGGMANLLFVKLSAGVIEFVGSPAAHKHLNKMWPPYKTYFYGGAGAAFPLFRVVLYEPDLTGRWLIRVDDMKEAVLDVWRSQPHNKSISGY